MTRFWDKFYEGLAEKWVGELFLPASAFLGIGLLSWIWQNGIDKFVTILQTLNATQGVLIIFSLFLFMAVLGWFVQQLTQMLLRWCEGYWPSKFHVFSRYLSRRVSKKIEENKKRLQELAQRFDSLNADELAEYNNLDNELSSFPKREANLMPTRLGNILKSAEEYSYIRYGLETAIVWPRLWLLLSEETRKEIVSARSALNERVQLIAWGILILMWTIWAWWMPFLTIIVIASSYLSLLGPANTFGDLVRAAFDLNRFKLYEALHWNLPNDLAKEKTCGEAITLYLHRGVF